MGLALDPASLTHLKPDPDLNSMSPDGRGGGGLPEGVEIETEEPGNGVQRWDGEREWARVAERSDNGAPLPPRAHHVARRH